MCGGDCLGSASLAEPSQRGSWGGCLARAQTLSACLPFEVASPPESLAGLLTRDWISPTTGSGVGPTTCPSVSDCFVRSFHTYDCARVWALPPRMRGGQRAACRVCFSFSHVGPRDQTEVLRPGGKRCLSVLAPEPSRLALVLMFETPVARLVSGSLYC